MSDINHVGPVGPEGPGLQQPKKPAPFIAPSGERPFSNILKESVDQVNQLQQEADLSVIKYHRGEATADEVMVSFQKAKIAFDVLTQIRNKLLDAFEELQRMRI